MLVQNSLHLTLNFVGIMFSTYQALATSCQTYPSEYVYHGDSVNMDERASANCRYYPRGPNSQEEYIHCDGTQLELIDSNLGSEQYQTTSYYWWPAGKDTKLLFIFPTRVSLTTIILHYYSDSDRGLPRLRFYAVPDDFDIWGVPTTSYPRVDVASVPPVGEPAGHRNVCISIRFNTKKVLMYMYMSSSSFELAVSEVEFFTCMQIVEVTTVSTSASSTLSVQAISDTANTLKVTEIHNNFTTNYLSVRSKNTSTSRTDTKMLRGQSIIAIGVSTAILLILSSTLIITVVVLIWNYKRRSAKQNLYTDTSYTTLSRQPIQPQSIQHNSAELYDQIHLSPSTGQTEFIPKPQSENINNPLHNSHPTHPDAENSMIHVSAASKTNSSMATYAAVDKSKKKVRKENTKHTAAEKKQSPPVSPYTQRVSSTNADNGAHAGGKDDLIVRSQKSLDDIYAFDHKDHEKVSSEQENNPPYTVEELYTVVKKKPKGRSVPENETVSHRAEDLYTAVMKKAEESSTEGEATPPHTVEELYTAVQKKAKGSTMKDEEEPPPIPPYMVEKKT